MTRERRLFRLLLHLYPASFRATYGDEMAWVFAQQLAEARSDGHGAVVSLWVRTVLDALVHGLRERADPEPVAEVAGGPGFVVADIVPPSPRMRRAALAPFAIPVVMLALGLGRAVFAKPPDIMGIPFGLILWAGALLWASLGAAIVLRTDRRTIAGFGLLGFTALAAAWELLTPLLIRWIVDLGSSNIGA